MWCFRRVLRFLPSQECSSLERLFCDSLPHRSAQFQLYRTSFSGMPPAQTFYAVRVGRTPGIYKTWAECQAHTKGFPKARFKKFNSLQEAKAFMSEVAETKAKPSIPRPSTSAGGAEQTVSDDGDDGIASNKKAKVFPCSRINFGNGFLSGPFSSSVAPRRNFSTASDALPPSTRSSLPKEEDGVAIVYTDGCCRSNGSKHAVAGIGVYWGKDSPLNVSEPLPGRAANNRAEIHAAIRAINQAKEQNVKKLYIYTDSQYLIKSMTEWIKNWQENDWKASNGKKVINYTDYQQLLEAMRNIELEWMHVPAHSGIFANEEADRLANEGALKAVGSF